jgi:hypothetical protein
MNMPLPPSLEVEQDRAEEMAKLQADQGADWEELNRPGTFGCHELLDRSVSLAGIVEQQLLSHPACVQNSEWYALAHQAVTALNDLYQRVGAVHLMAEPAGK